MIQTFGLGRGLSALIPTEIKNENKSEEKILFTGLEEMDINEILPNPNQPRREIDQETLLELANSIKTHGILQPLIVNIDNELIAGQRRLAAARLLGLKTVPVVRREVDEEKNLEMSIIENIQRTDLNAMEEAEGYQNLIRKFNLTQNQVAEKLGKSRSAVANNLRLLNLPIEIQNGVRAGKVSEGHAKLILSLDNPEKQIGLYKKILDSNISVRGTERLLKKVAVSKHTRKILSKNPFLAEAEENMQQALGARVKVTRDGRVGKIAIEFYSDEELEGIVKKIC